MHFRCVAVILLPFAAFALAARQQARFEFEQGGSPVAKIIQMLGAMKAKVASDIDTETKEMEEFMQFCDDESTTKVHALKNAERLLADLGATIANSGAIITEADDEIATMGTEISAKEKELADSTKIREVEHADFKSTEKDLAKSVDELTRAITAVKSGKASLLQSKKSRKSQKQYRELSDAVSTLIQSALLTGHQKRGLKAFIQSSSGDKDDASLSLNAFMKQRQGASSASKTEGILDVLGETKDKAEQELSSCRKAEMEASHEFQLLKQSLENEISTKKEKLATASSNKATAEQASGEAAAKQTETEKSKAADEAYLNSLKADCQGKAVEWEDRLKSAKGEIEAIEKATQILEDGVKAALVQVSTKVRRTSAAMRVKLHTVSASFSTADDDDNQSDDDEDEAENKEERLRAKLLKRLRSLASGHRSFALNQLVSRAKADPMAKIRGLIEEMIAKLTAEMAAEASKKAFCDEEMGKSKKAQADKTGKKDKYQARLDQAEATKVKLLAQISEAEAEMAEADNAQAEATKIRNAEHTEFLKAQSDYSSSENACAQAVEVLKQYYTGAAFIQVRATTRRSSSRLGVRGPDAGNAIIEFLEYAQQDFAKLLADVNMSEEQSQQAFEKMSTENKVAKATLQAEAKGAQSEVARLTDNIEDYKDDLSSTTKELEAVTMYLEKLKPECEAAPMSAADKIAARKQEIEGLKEALSILEGGM